MRNAPTLIDKGRIRLLARLALKLILVPTGLAWLAWKVLAQTSDMVYEPDYVLLFAAFAVNQLALGLFAERMRKILAVFGFPVGWASSLRIHLQSMFYFFALPMTVGMEIARFVKIRAEHPVSSKTALTAALFVDRAWGALSALLVAAATGPFIRFRASIPMAMPNSATLFLVLAALVVGGLVILPRSRNQLIRVLQYFGNHLPALLGPLAISIVVHLCFCYGVFVGALGLGLEIRYWDVLFAISAAMLLVVIPVSLAGVGPVEAGCIMVFVLLGYDYHTAVSIALISYLAKLIAAFEGGLWEMLHGGLLRGIENLNTQLQTEI